MSQEEKDERNEQRRQRRQSMSQEAKAQEALRLRQIRESTSLVERSQQLLVRREQYASQFTAITPELQLFLDDYWSAIDQFSAQDSQRLQEQVPPYEDDDFEEPVVQPEPRRYNHTAPPPFHNAARLHTIDAFDERNVPVHYCGTMSEVCRFCGARYWKLELNSKRKFNRCCNQGTIQLPKLTPPPHLFQELLIGHTQRSKLLLKKSRAFNTKISFGSVAMTSHDFPSARGVPSLRVSGCIYHNVESILPMEGITPSFVQCFFLETTGDDNAFKFSETELEILAELRTWIQNHNPFIQGIKQNMDRIQTADIPLYKLVLSDTPPPDAATRTYNAPTCSEMAAILIGDGESASNREVHIHLRGGGIRSIPSTHTSFDPMCYVLTHPYASICR